MPNTELSEYSTKKINKVSYEFSHEYSGDTLNETSGEVTANNQNILTRKASADIVIVEQPLQITLSWLEQGVEKSKVFTITMRTPGHDYFLIIGLLHSEGVIKQLTTVESIKIASEDVPGEGKHNEWLVRFIDGFIPDLSILDRYMVSYSSCGLCGATSLKTLQLKTDINLSYSEHKNVLAAQSILLLSSKMRREQGLFDKTGGVHGAALFDQQLNIQQLYEDIGRHNAVDKVIGALLASDKAVQKAPLWILLVSGRISFEIVQKTIMAGISVLVGVGAPSDLAIQAAKQFNLTLIGFVSNKGFNVYHGDWRLTNNIK
ncbi:formate dehydrogenase accessory sulfurtransferase FdhD [Colwellia sp. 12G3]|uniref:formate dehydrogenase accessory sulfurtransferase FdhD n=1 Tax=Colwellia sp. 12G3 TaxID=2058299 RepID=UPI000C3375FA|nr:formate dehydrogenase accessory sulfurtransferase FdhD [Colwellia sp. 12G3]PKI17621.1 formate dehydrogenase family accessory protein FdhD [Colwellia sp. 12G3]